MKTKIRVRSVIIENGSILLIRRIKSGETYWVFPGGGVEDSDSTHEKALERENLEELGVRVEVSGLFDRRVLPAEDGDQTEEFYLTRIVDGKLGTGTGPEFSRDASVSGTYLPEWVPIADLPGKNVKPSSMRDKILATR